MSASGSDDDADAAAAGAAKPPLVKDALARQLFSLEGDATRKVAPDALGAAAFLLEVYADEIFDRVRQQANHTGDNQLDAKHLASVLPLLFVDFSTGPT